MYKNNYITATFDDICAHLIQSSWKKYKIEQLNKEHKGMIEIIYTSLDTSGVPIPSRMNKIENLMTSLKLPFRLYDLMVYPKLKSVVKVSKIKKK